MGRDAQKLNRKKLKDAKEKQLAWHDAVVMNEQKVRRMKDIIWEKKRMLDEDGPKQPDGVPRDFSKLGEEIDKINSKKKEDEKTLKEEIGEQDREIA